MKRARWSELRKGDLSSPVLAILVTLILLSIGAAIIAYFTLFAGGTTAPVVAVKGQPIAYGLSDPFVDFAMVEVVIVNVGSAPFTIGEGTDLCITYPDLSGGLGLPTCSNYLIPLGRPIDRPIEEDWTVRPGESRTLIFIFEGVWDILKDYPAATGFLRVVDTAGNTVAMYEILIRVVLAPPIGG